MHGFRNRESQISAEQTENVAEQRLAIQIRQFLRNNVVQHGEGQRDAGQYQEVNMSEMKGVAIKSMLNYHRYLDILHFRLHFGHKIDIFIKAQDHY